MTADGSGTSREGLEERMVAQHLREVEDRLVTEYTGDDRVRHVLGLVRERFADASIRSFLPILVERAARDELNGSQPGRYRPVS
jgi:hypothetical protein